jgi:hypothetical protein
MPKHMKQSSGQHDKVSKVTTDLDFELPDEPGFISRTHPMSANALYRHNQWFVKAFNTRPGAEERRLRDKCDVPFVL